MRGLGISKNGPASGLSLNKGVPVAPAGYAFVVDQIGRYATDKDGNYFIVRIS